MQNIYIIGYPRSGNVWLSRLLGDIFNCTIKASRGRKSIADIKRPNKNYCVIQEHFFPNLDNGNNRTFVEQRTIFVKNKPDNAYLVFVYRNPLDVAVSVYKYWRMRSLMDTLKQMKNGGKIPVYRNYMLAWLDEAGNYIDKFISFEQMKTNLPKKLRSIACNNNLKDEIDYQTIIKRNHIENMRVRINEHPEQFSYHKGIQNKHLRKGIIGDWMNHFTKEDLEFAFDFMGDIIIMLGYFDKTVESRVAIEQHYIDALRYSLDFIRNDN